MPKMMSYPQQHLQAGGRHINWLAKKAADRQQQAALVRQLATRPAMLLPATLLPATGYPLSLSAGHCRLSNLAGNLVSGQASSIRYHLIFR